MSKLLNDLKPKVVRYATRTLYIAKTDADIWQDAVNYCNDSGVSLSKLVAEALQWYLFNVLKYRPRK